jgi:hypothetical protein
MTATEERFRKFGFSNPASLTLSKKRLVINSCNLRRPDFAHVREQSRPKRWSTSALQNATESCVRDLRRRFGVRQCFAAFRGLLRANPLLHFPKLNFLTEQLRVTRVLVQKRKNSG